MFIDNPNLVDNKHVFVTGGAGFIGSHLIKALISHNQVERVVVFDNLSAGRISNIPNHPKIQFIKGDLCQESKLLEATANIDVVFHLAAMTSVLQSIEEPETYFENNAIGTLRLFEAARSNEVKRVVVASTCAVYGEHGNAPVAEAHHLEPLSPYASSKLAAEATAEAFFNSYGLESVILRMFNVYGQGQNVDSAYASVIPRFFNALVNNNPFTIYGTGEQTRDFLHVSDAVQAFIEAGISFNQLESAHVFNIASGQSTSVLQLTQLMANISNKQPQVVMQAARKGEVIHSIACISQAQKLLSFTPQITLKDGLIKTWQSISTSIQSIDQLQQIVASTQAQSQFSAV